MRGDRGGDLQVRVDITEHERFQREGDDLYCLVTIDSFGAMLGTTVHVDGILAGEDVTVDIPAGCQHGERVTVEGAGMPRMGSDLRGNLVAVIEVMTPTDLTERQVVELRKIAMERGLYEDEDSPSRHEAEDAGKGPKSQKAWHFKGRKK